MLEKKLNKIRIKIESMLTDIQRGLRPAAHNVQDHTYFHSGADNV